MSSQCHLERLDCAKNYFRKIMERWNNLLTFERLILDEAYSKNRIFIICDLSVRGAVLRLAFSKPLDIEIAVGKLPISTGSSACPHQPDRVEKGNQELMLIHNVENVKTVQGIVPSTVGFYRVDDDLRDFGCMSLYFSFCDLTNKFIPRLIKREPNVSVPIGLRDNFPDDHIKSSVEVVNNIPDNQREFAGERVCFDDMKFAYSAISIKLFPDAINISLDIATQNSIKLTDVLVGPFAL